MNIFLTHKVSMRQPWIIGLTLLVFALLAATAWAFAPAPRPQQSGPVRPGEQLNGDRVLSNIPSGNVRVSLTSAQGAAWV